MYIDEIAAEIFIESHKTDKITFDELGEKEKILYRIYAVLCLAKGSTVSCGDVHNAWVVYTANDEPGHQYNIPFSRLPLEVQALDRSFMEAIRHVWAKQCRGFGE